MYKKILSASALLLLCAFALPGAERVLLDSPEEVFVKLRQNREWTFKADPAAGQVVVSFEQRLDFPRLGGWCPCWQIMVNDKFVTANATRNHRRLLNKPVALTHVDNGRFEAVAGNKWYALYSPDYEKAIAKFYPRNPEAYKIALEITDLLTAGKDNVIKIRFGSELSSFYKNEGVSREPALGVRNFKITQSDRPSDIPVEEELEVYIVTKAAPATSYDLGLAPDALTVKFGKMAVNVDSSFSIPGGGEAKMGGKTKLENDFYRVERTFVKNASHIRVFDKITSKSKELIGIKIAHELDSTKSRNVYVAGDPSPSLETNEGGRNPSVFLSYDAENQGIGLLAEDDVFRVQNIQYCRDGKAGIKSETFALSPGESRVAEWSIYPVMTNDYFDFVNAVRRDWDVNFPIVGGFHLSLSLFNDWDPERARKFHDDAGIKYNTTGVLFWKFLGGENASRRDCLHGAAFIDDESRNTESTTCKSEPMRQFVRKIMAEAKRSVPDVKRLVYVHNQWSNEIDDYKKYPDAMLTRADGTPRNREPFHFFVPTTENAFGRKFMKFLRTLCEEYDIDGIYHDEFTFSNVLKTYNMWDGVSVELDKNNRVARKVGFVPLLKLDFNMGIADYVLNQRKMSFIANFSPETRTERKFKYPRFEETYNSNWIFLSHLYTPIQLGDMLTYSATPRDCAADIRNAMRNGALYYHYNNQAACPTITQKMYPFTPVEIRGGCLIGKERILTIHSGEFGIPGEQATYTAYVYDELGALVKDYPYENIATPDGMKCRVLLKKDYCAALVKND